MSAGSAAPDVPSLLRQPDFFRFWSARLAATAASQMMMVALGWQMYDLTGSAWDLGLIGLAQFVPALLLALPAGHAIDRSDRKRVLAASMAVQLGVALLLAIGSWQHALGRGSLLLLSMLLGGVRAFQMPASQALLPQLVPTEVLPRALALSSSALQGAIIAGPALGGLLYGAGAEVVYGVSAAGFALSALAIAALHPRPAVLAREPMSMRSMLAGLHFIVERKVILGAVALDLFAVLLGGATALLPIFAKDILHVGPTGLGLLRGAPAVGALVMSLALARWPIERRCGTWLLGAVAAYGVTMVAFGLSRWFWLSLLALAVSGAVDMISVVIRHTLVQLETPDAMRGRVSAVNSVFIGASNQLGEFESGAVAAWLGPVASAVTGGIGTLLVVLTWIRLFPALARRDRLVRDDAALAGGRTTA
ncbi:MFS transporter [Aquincola sp. S2]|uniref:MFS transporter n=1 Tax=Pseudaquabacterium terrae TaxID=2732868 RepID=A0ABX2EHG0_9BURK|nr:MFS transporter [Aquabacterium terrae]NRF68021.1 MFS transporter [Aquabacterium terrae]